MRIIIMVILGIMAGSAVYWMVTITLQNVGQVFNTWDAVLSWNRWAVEWSSGKIPQHTDRYPQLLPANISLTYVFTANPQVQLFAKSAMPLFGLGILLIFFDLGMQIHPIGFFLAVVLARLMLKKFLGEFLTDGYADIPAAFFMTASAGNLYLLQQAKRRETAYPYLIFTAVFTAGAALSKQTGLAAVLLLPLVIYICISGSQVLSPKDKRRWLVQAVLICLALALPWYGVKEYQIATGIDDSNLAYVAGSIHREPNPINRIIPALGLLDKYVFLFLLILPVLWKFDRLSMALTVSILLPYTLGWATFFSYEVRTYALALPLLALSAGMAFEQWLRLGFLLLRKIRLHRWRIGLLLLVLVALLGGSGILVSREMLVEHQLARQKQIFGASLNQKLYDYAASSNIPMTILTNYPLAYLPGLENSVLTFYFNDFQVYDSLRRSGGFTHMLMPGSAQEAIRQDVQRRIDSGEFRLIFEDSSYGSYQFIKAR